MTEKLRTCLVITCFVLLLSFDLAANAPVRIDIIYASTMTNIGENPHGSYAQLSEMVKSGREQNENHVFLFGGGSLGPSALSSLDRGAHIIDLLNSIEPDAYGIGKREFSYFEDELSLRAYEAAFPMVVTNVFDPIVNDNLDGLHKSLIIEKQGVRIGVMSVVAESVTNEYGLKRAEVLPIKSAIEHEASYLRAQRVDIIILMYSTASEVVDTALQQGTIDLALRKDEHYELARSNQADHHNGNLILTDADTAFHISFLWEHRRPVDFEYRELSLLDFDSEETVADQEATYLFRAERLMQRAFATLEVPINTRRASVRSEETRIGNLLTDAMLAYTDADIALLNGGNIRGENSYPEGTRVTRRMVSDTLPYRNRIALVQLSGEQLYQVMEHSVSAIDESKGRFLQVAGLSVEYDPNQPPGSRIIDLKHDGFSVKPTQTFRVAITDYIANGGDDFGMLTQVPRLTFNNRQGALLSEVFVVYLAKNPSLAPKLESRIVSRAEQ